MKLTQMQLLLELLLELLLLELLQLLLLLTWSVFVKHHSIRAVSIFRWRSRKRRCRNMHCDRCRLCQTFRKTGPRCRLGSRLCQALEDKRLKILRLESKAGTKLAL